MTDWSIGFKKRYLGLICLIILLVGTWWTTDLSYEAESDSYEILVINRWSVAWMDDEIGGWQFWFYDGKRFLYRYPQIERRYPGYEA